ncbi:unnamed protein product [Adineta ricciae]|uniref:G-protein coupled receptors family 1 profile domain-containing protein n=1 Tax=Adineta ricciae TaxID=249248 RepID=A0A815SDP3_ADIRI|nr:unnamed protein product [Adineta ricciae]
MENTSAVLVQFRDESFFEDYFYPSLGMKFYLWGYLSLFIIGYTGNSASLITFTRPVLRASSTGTLFIALAISDYGLRFQLDKRIDFNFMCRWREFLMNASQFCSAWILVIIAMDRWIRTRFPYKSAAICTQKKALIAIAIVCSITIGLHVMFLTPLFGSSGSAIPYFDCIPMLRVLDDFIDFYYLKWPILQSLISCLAPAGLILVFIVDMFIKIRLQKKTIHHQVHNQNRNQTIRHNYRVQNQLFLLMLSNVIIFFTTTVQIGVYRILYVYLVYGSVDLNIPFITSMTVILTWFLGINYSVGLMY